MSSGKIILAGSERQPVGTRVGDLPGDETIEVSIILKPKVRAPKPENGGVAVTREEFAAKHGADMAVIEKIKQFAAENNLNISEISPERRTVKLQGTAANMLRAFEVKLERYEHLGHQYRARTGGINLPSDIAPSVEAVLGLDDRPQATAHFRVSGNKVSENQVSGESAPGQLAPRVSAAATVSYTPRQVAQLYQFPLEVDGRGQTVGILEFGGGYLPADLKTYFASLGVAAPTVVSVSVDNGKSQPTTPTSLDGEVMLDIEVVGAVAPGAKIGVYFAPNTSQGFLDALTTAIHDATNKPSVVSISWGGSESTWTTQAMTALDSAAQDAAALGVTICAASGDNGSSDGVNDGANHVDFPASSPHVLACGGTSLQSGNGVITSEVVWNDGVQGGATGGGFSNAFPLPDWQTSANITPPTGGGAVSRTLSVMPTHRPATTCWWTERS